MTSLPVQLPRTTPHKEQKTNSADFKALRRRHELLAQEHDSLKKDYIRLQESVDMLQKQVEQHMIYIDHVDDKARETSRFLASEDSQNSALELLRRVPLMNIR